MSGLHLGKSCAETTVEDCAIEIVAAMLNDRFGRWVPWAKLDEKQKDKLRHDASCIIEATHGLPAENLDPAVIDFVPSLFGMESGAGVGIDEITGLRSSTFSAGQEVLIR